jgi:hypothetical protein
MPKPAQGIAIFKLALVVCYDYLLSLILCALIFDGYPRSGQNVFGVLDNIELT